MPAGLAMDATRIMLVGSVVLLAASAVHDIATRTVPNWMPGILLVVGVALRALAHQLGSGMLCAVLVFVVTVFCWRRRWMGGADVKLLTVSVLLVPPLLVMQLLLSVALAGGLLVMLYLALRLGLRMTSGVRAASSPFPRGRSAGLMTRISRVEGRRIRRLESLPYASAIALGTIFIILHTV